jgi:hypothetical protein
VLGVLGAVVPLLVCRTLVTHYVYKHSRNCNANLCTSYTIVMVWPLGAAHLRHASAAVLISTTGKQHHDACALEELFELHSSKKLLHLLLLPFWRCWVVFCCRPSYTSTHASQLGIARIQHALRPLQLPSQMQQTALPLRAEQLRPAHGSSSSSTASAAGRSCRRLLRPAVRVCMQGACSSSHSQQQAMAACLDH